MRRLMGWIISLVVFFVLLMVAIWAFQSKLVYYPDKTITIEPSSAGLDFKNVFLTTSDGLKIHGWFIHNDKSKDVLLFCHGNGGNISGRIGIVREFYDLGLSVFIFDYRGYGKSEGKPNEKGTYKDVDAAWKWLAEEKKYSNDNIYVIGRSLGGAVALYITEKENPEKLILDSTFLSVADMAKHQLPFLPVFLIPLYKYSNKERIKKIQCPVLIIHSKSDDIIPYNQGSELFKLAKDPKTFLEIRGSHNDGFFESQDQYLKAVKEFISK